MRTDFSLRLRIQFAGNPQARKLNFRGALTPLICLSLRVCDTLSAISANSQFAGFTHSFRSVNPQAANHSGWLTRNGFNSNPVGDESVNVRQTKVTDGEQTVFFLRSLKKPLDDRTVLEPGSIGAEPIFPAIVALVVCPIICLEVVRLDVLCIEPRPRTEGQFIDRLTVYGRVSQFMKLRHDRIVANASHLLIEPRLESWVRVVLFLKKIYRALQGSKVRAEEERHGPRIATISNHRVVEVGRFRKFLCSRQRQRYALLTNHHVFDCI